MSLSWTTCRCVVCVFPCILVCAKCVCGLPETVCAGLCRAFARVSPLGTYMCVVACFPLAFHCVCWCVFPACVFAHARLCVLARPDAQPLLGDQCVLHVCGSTCTCLCGSISVPKSAHLYENVHVCIGSVCPFRSTLAGDFRRGYSHMAL